MRRVHLVVALVAAAVAAMVCITNVAAVGDPSDWTYEADELPYTALYDQPTSRLHVLLNLGDGQAFAALAVDPTISHPEVFRDGDAEAAYRWQRPLLGYMAWVGALGDPEDVPASIFVLGVLSVGLLAGVVARAATRTGRTPWLGLGVLVLPGVQSTVLWGGPEPLLAALTLVGLSQWSGGERRRAGWWWALAALGRETLAIVPAAVAAGALWQWWRGGPVRTTSNTVRTIGLCAVPTAIVLTVWWTVVFARVGFWPWQAGDGRLGLPGVGLARAVGGWDSTDLAMAAVIGLCAVVALASGRGPLRWVAGAHVALALCMGELVWGRWHDFGRPLLPLCAIGLSLARPPRPTPEPASAPSCPVGASLVSPASSR